MSVDMVSIKDALIVTGGLVGIAFQLQTLRNKRAESRPVIKLVQSGGLRVGPLGPSDPLCMIEAQNHGACPVVLSSFGFRLPDSKSLVFHDELGQARFPLKLEPGDAAQVGMFFHNLVGSLAHEGYPPGTQLRPFVRDKLSRVFYGKKFAVR